MTDRRNRYTAFDNFSKGSKELFLAYGNSTVKSKRLNGLYSLCISPGGRYGGLSKKNVDVFYGNRPFDSIIEMRPDYQMTEKLETAYGATLSYQRTDDGQVLCYLAPAGSANFNHPEDCILLGMVKNPAKLAHKTKWHWRMFQAYMESTCLDGRPSLFQKILVSYLRNFKTCVVNKTVQKRRVAVFLSELAKYTVTVGLSGFIILIITWSKDSIDSNQTVEKHREVLSVYSNIADSAREIAKSSEVIEARIKILDQTTSENLKLLNLAILESASRIEKSLNNLKESSEAEAKSDDAQHTGE
ncbi:hypothetical protein [Marinomonas sp. TW1]|uniref:hypothetical protein n=1 Tax=Marinomonas sp. TW1 TaxID=1561203 RepID=UPI0007AF2FAE|nr:hypothetical protein [Marinomonas sp. TW1]KZN12584.1 hypothetical protein OA79_14990 [Marinomonas sp. TW1]